VMALEVPEIGHVVRETDYKLIIFGERNSRCTCCFYRQ
jgi:hypothetical protein